MEMETTIAKAVLLFAFFALIIWLGMLPNLKFKFKVKLVEENEPNPEEEKRFKVERLQLEGEDWLRNQVADHIAEIETTTQTYYTPPFIPAFDVYHWENKITKHNSREQAERFARQISSKYIEYYNDEGQLVTLPTSNIISITVAEYVPAK
jgi:hypothetical protein